MSEKHHLTQNARHIWAGGLSFKSRLWLMMIAPWLLAPVLLVSPWAFLPIGVLALFVSVGWVKRIEREQARLLAEKQRADLVTASIADGVVLLRGDDVLFLNPVGAQLLGVPPDSNGLKLSGLAATGRKGIAARTIMTAISQTIPVELALEHEDQRSYYLIQAFPVARELMAPTDVGDANPELAPDTTLVVAQDMTLVRESQEAKSHFLATLSHEVKTPVTSLTMATRLLQKFVDQIPNPTHRNLILTCVSDVDRLRKLLDDLLTVSRLETLTQRLAVQQVDFVKLLKHSVQSFQSQANERGVSLTFATFNFECAMSVPMDPAKVSWAFSNLLTNALRHTPRGGRVEVQLHLQDQTVEVRVRDSGPGVERKRLNRIFDKFSSYYDIRVARSGGAGTGLSIAREIVVAHGGRIWVTSDAGQGAEFCFSLPLKQAHTEAFTHPSAAVRDFRSEKEAGNGQDLSKTQFAMKGVTTSGASSRS